MAEPAQVPGDVVDQRGVELDETLDECRRAWRVPEQVVQSGGAVQIGDLCDERSTEIVDRGLLLPQSLGQYDESRLHLVEVPFREPDEQGVLVGEVLIERSDRDPRSLGDVIGRRVVVAERLEKASSLVEDAGDKVAGPLLTGATAWFRGSSGMRVARHEQYSHNRTMRTITMRTITVSTELDAPADVVWAAATTPHAFVHVAKGMLRFPAAERLDRPWRVGDEVRGWTLLFGFIPFSIHWLSIESIDDQRRRILSDERGGMVRTWRHELLATPLGDDRCKYTDRIDIDAGVMTPLVAGFAAIFYRYRQRRWRALAPLLAATAVASTIGAAPVHA
jgi:hypothetical protein